MIEKIRAMKNKKGFTLVELIVVLVILAILAALLIPALTGYIDKANKEKVTAECRMVVMAAQTEASEQYGALDSTVAEAQKAQKIADAMKVADIKKLSETNGSFAIKVDGAGKVRSVEYYNNGFKCTYTSDASSYVVAPGTATENFKDTVAEYTSNNSN
ncbi:MAG: prepilin-type N-terminal cleavage/methylation domain-containing protein [Subdoligranulum variabile]|uniref:prepilin-type N-terminal cleavage/methylation domain-containing protein n=1 Tax=Gemmiger sp. TaxID=2049027 RepID=UPI002A828288|nr:prepilin-type N-terminal cleavage/methylation domain-containing protein [Gemmiger sp.]MCI7640714.1 prepilin-type N-terminal cleavage/methylation domain-containing protein [Subdoligranulum variabile]MDY4773984.1 prepilin-type N-terminal cleavage/methylation domain-containing protein [Gemmiger sp.]